LFGDTGQADALALPPAEAWGAFDQASYEAEAIGFHLTAHPLDAYGATLRRLGVVAGSSLAQEAVRSSRAKVAGSVVAIKERTTQKGTRMAWLRLSDAAGSFEVTLFSEVLGRARPMIAIGAMVLVTVELKLEGEALRITALDVSPLDEAAAGAGLRIWVGEAAAVDHLRSVLERAGRGGGRVALVPRIDADRQVEIALPGFYAVSPRLAQALTVLPGVERVEDM
jgi:DNA polymerase-3 subunit alpha